MHLLWLLMVMQQAPPPRLWQQVVESLERSGRLVEIVEPVELPAIAPGAPPLLSFRYIEGQRKHRFGDLGLVMDDAGH